MARTPLLTLFAVLSLLSCSPGGRASMTGVAGHGNPANTLTIFAASSLTAAFQEIATAFEVAHPGTRISLNLANSQQLALQIEQGAQADVLAVADDRTIPRLAGEGVAFAREPQPFAHNRMAIALPADNPGRVESLADLARPGLKLVLVAESVPAGAYARQVLDKASADPAYGPGFKDAVLGNVVSNEENVKQVLAKVQLGEADAGIVYRSDLVGVVLEYIDIPGPFDVTATYQIGALGSASAPELASQFVQFVLSPEGGSILQCWGLIPIAAAEK